MKKKITNIRNLVFKTVKSNLRFYKYDRISYILIFGILINSLLLRVFTLGFTHAFGLRAIVTDAVFTMVLISFGFLFKKTKARQIYNVMLAYFFAFYMLAQVNYYQYYLSYISISSLFATALMGGVTDSIFDLISPIDFIYFWHPVILHVFYKRKYFLATNLTKNARRLIRYTILSIATTSLVLVVMSMSAKEFSRFTKQWNKLYLVENFGIMSYQFTDALIYANSNIVLPGVPEKKLVEYEQYLNDTNAYDYEQNSMTNLLEGKNLLMLHYESMQQILIDKTINGVEITPNLNKLIKKSMYFDNFYSEVTVGTSSDTELSVNTGLYPINNETAFISRTTNKYESIEWMLQEKDYTTFSMHGNDRSMWNRNVMHPVLGYQKFYDKKTYDIDHEIGLGLSDTSFYEQSVKKIEEIKNQGKPFMGTLISLTNHTPFEDNEAFSLDVGILQDTRIGDYIKSAHYADEALGVLIDELEKKGMFKDTAIVIYGDHDAKLGTEAIGTLLNYNDEEKIIYDSLDQRYIDISSSNFVNYELSKKVPLVIYTEGIEPEVYSDPMGMTDAHSTILNFFGMHNPYSFGRDYFNFKEEQVIFPNGDFLTKDIYFRKSSEIVYNISENILTEEQIKALEKKATDKLFFSSYILRYNLLNLVERKEE